jgi:AMP nucleosidase
MTDNENKKAPRAADNTAPYDHHHFEPVATRSSSEACDLLIEIYEGNTGFLQSHFEKMAETGTEPKQRVSACYPLLSVKIDSFSRLDSRLSYGHVSEPGLFATTITNPHLFREYLETQIGLLIKNHDIPVRIGVSDEPIPLHFALGPAFSGHGDGSDDLLLSLRNRFDVPDLSRINDDIVNGVHELAPDAPMRPLAPFTAPRIDYSLLRLSHYTATAPTHFQNFVLFTNYQFYMDEFKKLAQELMADGNSEYSSFVESGNVITHNGEDAPSEGVAPARSPQMPTYHLTRPDRSGITLVNIGVGPSNAKTITDHVAVLRPHAWLMLGHCAGLRNSQALGDYVLAHAYVREDHVLDADLPVWVPVPALAEVQVALEKSVAEVTGLEGYELKKVMRTGTIATIDNRNWELVDQRGPVQRLSQSRAIALDMESATIAANGFRCRVPYGTLLCVSDKPLHGELKLPGMASAFYKKQVSQHLDIGIKAMEKLRALRPEQLHSRKLRSFSETAFQ